MVKWPCVYHDRSENEDVHLIPIYATLFFMDSYHINAFNYLNSFNFFVYWYATVLWLESL